MSNEGLPFDPTIALWGTDDFVIYYRSRRVPLPGIVILGKVTGDALFLIAQVPSPFESSAWIDRPLGGHRGAPTTHFIHLH